MNIQRALIFSFIVHIAIALLFLGRDFDQPDTSSVAFDLVLIQGVAQEQEPPQAEAKVDSVERSAKNIEKSESTPSEEVPFDASLRNKEQTATEVSRVGEVYLNEVIGRAPENDSERYLSELRLKISRAQTYPKAAKSFREEGSVRLRITIAKDGSLKKLEVLDKSPYQRLNDAAVKAVASASPFPPFPDSVDYDLWKVSLPIRFTLSN